MEAFHSADIMSLDNLVLLDLWNGADEKTLTAHKLDT